jgi:hypothetical protein
MLTKEIDDEREILNLTDYDELFERMLYSPSLIDEEGLMKRLSFINRLEAEIQ